MKLLRKENKNPPKEDKCKYIKDVYSFTTFKKISKLL